MTTRDDGIRFLLMQMTPSGLGTWGIHTVRRFGSTRRVLTNRARLDRFDRLDGIVDGKDALRVLDRFVIVAERQSAGTGGVGVPRQMLERRRGSRVGLAILTALTADSSVFARFDRIEFVYIFIKCLFFWNSRF